MSGSPILQRFMKDLAGYNLNDAAGFLATLAEFDAEDGKGDRADVKRQMIAASSRARRLFDGKREIQAAFPVPPGPGSSRKLSRLFRSKGAMASNRLDSRVYLTS